EAGVLAAGYARPTPIQEQAIPPVMEGRDLLGLAQTGTGKTAAFVLPILQRLLSGPRRTLRALIVAPTRELAEQTHEFFSELGRKTGLVSITIYGGVSMRPQVTKLAAGADIVVACPGRLLDHLGQGTINLSKVEVLVLDEADRMFDMGFLPDIRRIIGHLPSQRQTLLFAATMPDDIRRLARDIMNQPATVQIGQVAPAETVAHALYPIEPHLKTPLLMELLQRTDTDSVLVFTRTKHRAKRLGEQLQRAGFQAASLQGNLSQPRRQEAMEGFRDGSYRVLVATDIAARGLDVSLISHVINYDIPDTVDTYIHRIGRTGRAEKNGEAYTLITGEDREMVQAIERLLGEQIERRRIDGFDYKAPAPSKNLEFARPPLPSRRNVSTTSPQRDTTSNDFRDGRRTSESSSPRPRSSSGSSYSRDDSYRSSRLRGEMRNSPQQIARTAIHRGPRSSQPAPSYSERCQESPVRQASPRAERREANVSPVGDRQAGPKSRSGWLSGARLMAWAGGKRGDRNNR
ncbi:MAG: DEAD/DEAH box helicase, partial [Coprothermobacterota bacterium]|nr:DEAD/DEAH box helicase [Coprothermobacterota bacterium]